MKNYNNFYSFIYRTTLKKDIALTQEQITIAAFMILREYANRFFKDYNLIYKQNIGNIRKLDKGIDFLVEFELWISDEDLSNNKDFSWYDFEMSIAPDWNLKIRQILNEQEKLSVKTPSDWENDLPFESRKYNNYIENYKTFKKGQLVSHTDGYKRKDVYIFIGYNKEKVVLINMWGESYNVDLETFAENYQPIKLDFSFTRDEENE